VLNRHLPGVTPGYRLRWNIHGTSLTAPGAVLLAGDWTYKGMIARTATALDRKWAWRCTVARHLAAQYAAAPPYDELRGAIGSDPAFCRAIDTGDRPRIVCWFAPKARMIPFFPKWDLKRLDSVDDICSRLNLPRGKLFRPADSENRQGRGDETIDRREYDLLKAVLVNCLRHGPASQNRRGHPRFREHLQGRVAFVKQVNPGRGEKPPHSKERSQHFGLDNNMPTEMMPHANRSGA
jgi:hypothetical protein